MGVPLPAEHRPDGLQLLVAAAQQHQLPGDLHDQRRALLRGATHLRLHGDVPRGTAAVPPRQGLPLHLRLLCRVRHVPGDCHRRAGARLADLLQQEAAGPVVHRHAGEEEEMSAGAKGCWVILSTLVAELAARKERDTHKEQFLIIKND